MTSALDLFHELWSDIGGVTTLHHLDGSNFPGQTFKVDDADGIARWLDQHHEHHAYYRVTPMAKPPARTKRGTESASLAVPSLFGDYDWKSERHPLAPPEAEVRAALDACPHPPSVVIESGNGIQAHWLLDEPCIDLALAKSLNLRLTALVGLTNDRTDLASVLRCPGTLNNGTEVRIVKFEPGLRYSVDDLDERLEPLGYSVEVADVELATTAEVDAFLDQHTADEYPGALTALVAGVAGTIERQGGARHPSLRMLYWQALREASVGAYPARIAVEKITAAWLGHLKAGEKRPANETGNLLAWQVAVVSREDREALTEVRARLDDVFGDTDAGKPGDSESGTTDGKRPSARDRLVELVVDQYDIGRTEDERPFVVAHDGPNVALFGGAAKSTLARQYRATYGTTVGRSPLDEAWLTIEGLAHDEPKRPLALRVATTDAGHLVVDIGDVSGRAVIVEPGCWRLVDRSPVTFRRSRAMLALPEPESGGDLAELLDMLRLAPRSRDLFGAWLTLALFEDIPHPAPVLRGEQGSAKTTTARVPGKFIDPCTAETQKPPRNDDEWSNACQARWVVSVDNVSSVPEWWSDALCRTVTGDGWLRRKLYEDEEVIATKWRRVVVLNGITLGASLRPDLTERLVLFELERPERYLTEREVNARLDDMAPRVLGALLDRAAGTLAELSNVEPVRDLRMADFAHHLAAYDHAHGTDTLGAYRREVSETFEEALAADPLAVAVVDFMSDRYRWTGSAGELLGLLGRHRPIGDHGYWPTTPHHLSNAMTRSATSLRRVGIRWAKPGTESSGRAASLTRDDNASSPPAPHLPPLAHGSTVSTAAPDAPDAPDFPLVAHEGGKEGTGRTDPQAQQGGNQAHEAHEARPLDPSVDCLVCGAVDDLVFGCECDRKAS